MPGLSSNPMLNENKPVRFSDPNKYAPKPFHEFINDTALIHGYQDFVLTHHSISLSSVSTSMLQRKYRLIKDYLRPQFFKNKLPDLSHQDVLDIGGNGGFFSYWSVLHGANQAISIDLDTKYVNIVNEVSKKLGFSNVTSVEYQISDWYNSSDIVLALAMVHWLYSCTEIYGSLDQVIGKLASLTKNLLIVEWVEPSDSAIEFFHHIEWNADFIHGPYTLEAFEQALSQHFAHFEVIGQVSPTRTLYAATVKMSLLELGGPMALLQEPNTLLSSHFLTNINGVDYWSRVYKLPDENHIIKQSSLDLAEREYWFLSRLTGDYFPKAYSFAREEGYSTVEIEYITGAPLLKVLPELQASFETITAFFRSCLLLLYELQILDIRHRDISVQNIIIRDNKPVLLDFGWAEASRHLVDTCAVMGGEYQPIDTIFCDTYALGKVLKKVNQGLYPQLDKLIGLMIEENRSLRITDAGFLQVLLDLMVRESLSMNTAEQASLSDQEKQLSELANYLYNSNQQLILLKADLISIHNHSDNQERIIEDLTGRLSILQTYSNRADQAEQALSYWKGRADQADQALSYWKERADQDEQALPYWKERAEKNFQGLQTLQNSRIVKIAKVFGNLASRFRGN